MIKKYKWDQDLDIKKLYEELMVEVRKEKAKIKLKIEAEKKVQLQAEQKEKQAEKPVRRKIQPKPVMEDN